MSLTNKIINGSDLMLFKDGKSIAHASSHTLSIEPQISEINTKDTGIWGMSEVTKVNWSLNSEHLYVQKEFVNMFEEGVEKAEPFEVYFGLKKGYKGGSDYNPAYTYNVTNDGYWTPDTSSYLFCGYVLINNLEVSAQAGENATFSVGMTGTGELKKSYYSA